MHDISRSLYKRHLLKGLYQKIFVLKVETSQTVFPHHCHDLWYAVFSPACCSFVSLSFPLLSPSSSHGSTIIIHSPTPNPLFHLLFFPHLPVCCLFTCRMVRLSSVCNPLRFMFSFWSCMEATFWTLAPVHNHLFQ